MRRRKKDIAQEAEDVLCSLFARAEELEDPKSEEQNLIQEACEKPRVVSGEDELGFPKTSWDALVEDARSTYRSGHHAEGLLTEEELAAAGERVRILNEEYNALHRLDHVDIAISVSAGTLSSFVDILLVGIPERTPDGLRGRPLENYVRDWFLERFPPKEMERLARDVSSKVPYDAPYNTGFTNEYVEGLWPTMHRLYSLGHDPLLGFVVGTLDILRGRMTTIDKFGKILSQEIPRYAGREEATVFAALCKQLIHFKSDVTTSMGLPAPFMGLFNLMQFGSVGEEEQTIAEIVQGMYYEGYDFQHFCAQSVPVMLTEVVVRLGYFLKRVAEGHGVKESIPVTADRERRPKLGTMLFTAHSLATAVNAGRVAFTKDPMAINYPQWLFFAYRSFAQAKWAMIEKPLKRHEYVMQALEADIAAIAFPEVAEIVVLGDEVPMDPADVIDGQNTK
ncbi:hypothetical protein [Olsenella uli]|uniref:hypothetical protein n=1 Tax=Olsenella uli TaxID=133926 RepID=UPI0016518D3D|nr:hypothetical protein [Olsenella uli]